MPNVNSFEHVYMYNVAVEISALCVSNAASSICSNVIAAVTVYKEVCFVHAGFDGFRT